MTLIQIAFVLFAVIAGGGVILVALLLTERRVPAFLGPSHGLGGLIALAVLLDANLQGAATPGRAWWAFGVLAAGFLGGLGFFRILFRKSPPVLFIAGHASVAVIGLALLYGAAF